MNKKMESAVTIVFLVQKQTHPGILPVEKKARTSCGEKWLQWGGTFSQVVWLIGC